MPSISFPRGVEIPRKIIDLGIEKAKQTRVDNNYILYNTKELKNQLLLTMLEDNLKYKNKDELSDYCVRELKLISNIVSARGNIGDAYNSLIRLMESYNDLNQNHINNLLALFQNRNTGIFGNQNINRTAAEYVKVIYEILRSINMNDINNKLMLNELRNINVIMSESKKCYRDDYIINISIRFRVDNILEIQFGRSVHTMRAEYNHFEIKMPSLEYGLLAKLLDEENYSKEAKSTILECFENKSKSLYLINCKLTEVPKDEILAKITHVRDLSLKGNNISHVKSGAFSSLYNLTKLDLSDNKTISIETCAFTSDNLSKLKLKHLILQNNEISDLSFLSEPSLCSLRYLYLSDNNIKCIGKDNLSMLENLSSLDMSYNELQVLNLKELANLKKIETLDFAFNEIKTIINDQSTSLPKLKELYLKDNKIDTIERSAFNGLNSLKRLSLRNNKISGVENIFNNLEKLCSIDLSDNISLTINQGDFKDLVNLKEVYLSGIDINSIEQGAFSGLNCLKIVLFNKNTSDNHMLMEEFYSRRQKTVHFRKNTRYNRTLIGSSTCDNHMLMEEFYYHRQKIVPIKNNNSDNDNRTLMEKFDPLILKIFDLDIKNFFTVDDNTVIINKNEIISYYKNSDDANIKAVCLEYYNRLQSSKLSGSAVTKLDNEISNRSFKPDIINKMY